MTEGDDDITKEEETAIEDLSTNISTLTIGEARLVVDILRLRSEKVASSGDPGASDAINGIIWKIEEANEDYLKLHGRS